MVPDPPRCAHPETEPNTPVSPEVLPLETLGCGSLFNGFDNDAWDVTVDHATWLGVYIDAERIGSRADLVLTMTSQEGEAAQVFDSPYSSDIRLRMPTAGDTFTVLVTDRNANGGEVDFEYEILATEIKEPVPSNLNEVEPNNTRDLATQVTDGDSVWGDMATNTDEDWFYIDIPSGKHTVTLDLQGWEFGSSGNFRIRRTGPNGETNESGAYLWDSDPLFDDGDLGREHSDGDPYAVFESFGDERVWFKVIEFPEKRAGKAYWYVIDVSVEGSG